MVWRFLTPDLGDPRSLVTSVAAADVPPDGALVIPEQRVAIVRDADGSRALDLTCTHLGCTVSATSDGFTCPCHGSHFDCRGQVSGGPAARGLEAFALEERDGTIRIYRG